MEYKVLPGYLFVAKAGHLQGNVLDETGKVLNVQADNACRRVFDRITKSKGTIVAVHVKDRRHTQEEGK